MRCFKVVKFSFLSPLHIGKGLPDEYGNTEAVYHSDSLKAALFVMALKLNSNLAVGEENAKKFHSSFQLSSCMPFYQEEFFFPRPVALHQIAIEGEDATKARKMQKKIAYLSKPFFEQFINGIELQPVSKTQILDSIFLSTIENVSDEPIRVIAELEQQRLSTLNKDGGGNPTPYYFDRIFFAQGAGLYALIDTDDETWSFLQQCFELLGEEGIGTDRSAGNGQFKPSFLGNFEINCPEVEVNGRTNLGLYLPEESEHRTINWNESYWTLMKRGGYIAGSDNPDFYRLRKKSVFMLGESSLFVSDSSSALKGKMVNLRPEWNDEAMHDVWRDGAPIFLPVKVKVNAS